MNNPPEPNDLNGVSSTPPLNDPEDTGDIGDMGVAADAADAQTSGMPVKRQAAAPPAQGEDGTGGNGTGGNGTGGNGTGGNGTGEQGIGDLLAQATTLLRQHTDAGWKAIEDTVIARAFTLFRPSAPVRARHESGDFFLASDIVVARLRQVIDDVPQAAAQRIVCTTGERDELDLVTIQLIAAYGAPLLELASRVHVVALRQLRELLGGLAPLPAQVLTHVHIGDVSNDPRIVS